MLPKKRSTRRRIEQLEKRLGLRKRSTTLTPIITDSGKVVLRKKGEIKKVIPSKRVITKPKKQIVIRQEGKTLKGISRGDKENIKLLVTAKRKFERRQALKPMETPLGTTFSVGGVSASEGFFTLADRRFKEKRAEFARNKIFEDLAPTVVNKSVFIGAENINALRQRNIDKENFPARTAAIDLQRRGLDRFIEGENLEGFFNVERGGKKLLGALEFEAGSFGVLGSFIPDMINRVRTPDIAAGEGPTTNLLPNVEFAALAGGGFAAARPTLSPLRAPVVSLFPETVPSPRFSTVSLRGGRIPITERLFSSGKREIDVLSAFNPETAGLIIIGESPKNPLGGLQTTLTLGGRRVIGGTGPNNPLGALLDDVSIGKGVQQGQILQDFTPPQITAKASTKIVADARSGGVLEGIDARIGLFETTRPEPNIPFVAKDILPPKGFNIETDLFTSLINDPALKLNLPAGGKTPSIKNSVLRVGRGVPDEVLTELSSLDFQASLEPKTPFSIDLDFINPLIKNGKVINVKGVLTLAEGAPKNIITDPARLLTGPSDSIIMDRGAGILFNRRGSSGVLMPASPINILPSSSTGKGVQSALSAAPDFTSNTPQSLVPTTSRGFGGVVIFPTNTVFVDETPFKELNKDLSAVFPDVSSRENFGFTPITGVYPRLSSGQSPFIDVNLGVDVGLANKDLLRVPVLSGSRIDSAVKVDVAQSQKQDLRLENLLKVLPRTVTAPKLVPNTDIIRLTDVPPPSTGLIFGKLSNEPKGRSKGLFRVTVGRPSNKIFKDFGLVDIKGVQSALRFTKTTAAASIRVEPIKGVFPRGVFGSSFRPSKRDPFTFIQRREKRLSRKEEVLDLQRFNPLRSKSSFSTINKLVSGGNSLRTLRRLLK